MGDWFANWFDCSYYHVLYANRDHREAADFIERLVKTIPILPHMTVLDLACGKGRHSMELNRHQLRVTGVDLSAHSIEKAKAASAGMQGIEFFVHDMREPIANKQFDVILNLFTSFGYFKNEADNQRVLQAVYQMLKPGGYFLLDFLNVSFLTQQTFNPTEIDRNGITFHVQKQIKDGWVYKDIAFHDGGRDFSFREEVRLFTENELKAMLAHEGLRVLNHWGNYHLDNPNDASDRCVLLAKKD